MTVPLADELTINQRILNALSEHDFFDLIPDGQANKEVYKTQTGHILECSTNQVTLAIRVTQKDPGTIADLVRLSKAFCLVLDPTWVDAFGWVNQSLSDYEKAGQDVVTHRENANLTVTLKPNTEIGYIFIEAKMPQAADTTT